MPKQNNVIQHRTPLQQHIEKWKECTACDAHKQRQRVVLIRGTIPCDVLFIGEAPGHSEDILGSPFVGPAGMLLQKIINRSVTNNSYALTNLVACIPLNYDGEKTEEPSIQSIQACGTRLQEIVDLANPRLVVLVGKLSKSFLTKGYKSYTIIPREANTVVIDHLAYILRMSIAQKGLAIQRCEVVIRNAVEEMNEKATEPAKD